jgi:hypothetical protein
MMNTKTQFFFYLAALVCFALASIGGGSRSRIASRLSFLPLGLGLWILPLVWNTGHAAFK